MVLTVALHEREESLGVRIAETELHKVFNGDALEGLWAGEAVVNEELGDLDGNAFHAVPALDGLGDAGVESVTWSDYPILRFDEVPPIDVELVAMPNATPWGAGEISQGATMAAIGNALAQALGARIRAMPFTRQRIEAALLQDSAVESDDGAAG